jgi:hypothetical protein
VFFQIDQHIVDVEPGPTQVIPPSNEKMGEVPPVMTQGGRLAFQYSGQSLDVNNEIVSHT